MRIYSLASFTLILLILAVEQFELRFHQEMGQQ